MCKIVLQGYQTLSSKQPAYLHSLLTPARQPSQLRSSNSNLLFVSVKTNVGTRAFSVAAPTLWNSLPVSVKSVRNIETFRCKPTCFNLLILHTNPSVYNWNCLSIMNCLAPFVLVRCRTWISRGFSAIEVFYILHA